MFEMINGMKIIAECSIGKEAPTINLSKPMAVVMKPGPGNSVNISLVPPTEPLFETVAITVFVGSLAFYVVLGDNMTPRQTKIRDLYKSAVGGVIIPGQVNSAPDQKPPTRNINGLY